ncbi:carbamoyltransferase [Thermodesulfobacteriota bacterium]
MNKSTHSKAQTILGISAYYHDSAAALLIDGKIIAAAQEERFTRKKYDPSFPAHAVRYVMTESGITLSDLDAVAFYDKPFLKFERLLETYHAFAPAGLSSFLKAIPVWIKEKLFLKKLLLRELDCIAGKKISPRPQLLFPEHHLSHAASAFYPSPFAEAAILTIDGVGEWATTAISEGRNKSITILREIPFPHSLGLLYSAFTFYCGFKVNSGEYKLMGLAPYGKQNGRHVSRYKKIIREHLVDIRDDGSILLNMDYFNFATGLTMCRDDRWLDLFGITRRQPDEGLSQSYMDMALAIQHVTEDIILRLAKTARDLTGCENLVMAGGVALNCVANSRLQHSRLFKHIWIQPAAGDAGGAVGAAFAAYHIWQNGTRVLDHQGRDAMQGAYLGPEYNEVEIRRLCRKHNAPVRHFDQDTDLFTTVSKFLARGEIVGWFQGRMEYGPRALGNRSILGDPRNPEMQKTLNVKIKYREEFRPFAPSVLAEDAEEYFQLSAPSPYMLLVEPVQEGRRIPLPHGYDEMDLYERLYQSRSDIPAVTHIDFTARIQTVHRETNERYWRLLKAFKDLTGYGLLVNTSFNVRGEPIVCTPEDAYRCFMRTKMDWLVIGNFLFCKEDQPHWQESGNWQQTYEID